MKQHILVLEDAARRRTIVLNDYQYMIGRHTQSDIQLNSRQASRHHATLVRKINSGTQEECFWIIDGDLDGNKSQNGVFVNGEKRLIHELKNGDLINFGCNINASYHTSGQSIDMPSAPLVDSSQPGSDYETISAQSSSFLAAQREEPIVLPQSDEDTFHEQSYLDTVTDLPNRTLFVEYLNIAVSNARRNQTQVGLLLCQMANWTEMKRKRGDGVANLLLQEAGKKLKFGLRNGDIVSRWDNDQFILLLSKVQDKDSLAAIANRLMKPLVIPVMAGNKPFEPEIRYSTVLYLPDENNIDQVLGDLQRNLQPIYYTPPVEQSSTQSRKLSPSSFETAVDVRFEMPNTSADKSEEEVKRLEIVEKRLERALEQHELELFYQPQINWQTKTIETMEAFIRWQHPKKGLLSPHQFLPWSDQSEFLVPLTQWILNTACDQNQRWQAYSNSPFLISVNVSEKQFYHPKFEMMVLNALSASGLEPQLLELELRESTIIQDFSTAQKIIKALHQQGICFSLDDFGTDYVALRYLQEIPFHKIKIDKSLSQKLLTEPENTDNVAMIKTLVALGKGFNLKVVAEGVEQVKQINFFEEAGCDLMQGFCFSEPLNLLAANSLLKRHQIKVLGQDQD
ncbi:MAG: EAL domain-containing protein [Synechocystis sp.]|nr:EAL domain-containing protein [Synechocystis sp.]